MVPPKCQSWDCRCGNRDDTEANYYLLARVGLRAIMDTEDTNTLYSLRQADLQKLNQYIK